MPQPAFKFPFVATNDAEFLGQEAAQPPLYYMITAPVISLFDTDQSKEITTFNPRAALGDASFPSNKNGFVHGPWEQFPGEGHVAAVYAVRAISVLFGLGTILAIFGAARLFLARCAESGTVGGGLVAALPQFTFQHSLVSNDGFVTFLVSLGLYLLVRFELLNQPSPPAPLPSLGEGSNVRRDDNKSFSPRGEDVPKGTDEGGIWQYVGLGCVIGLAILTKNQGRCSCFL